MTNPNVGYNGTRRQNAKPAISESTRELMREAGRRGAYAANARRVKQPKTSKVEMSEERREQFRAWGREGARRALEKKRLYSSQ